MITIYYTIQLTQYVKRWPGITTSRHRYMATQFNFHGKDIGHIHWWGLLDIQFKNEKIYHYLLGNKMVSKHHHLPESQWTTFRIKQRKDIRKALTLLKISQLCIIEKPDIQKANKVRLLKELKLLSLPIEITNIITQMITK